MGRLVPSKGLLDILRTLHLLEGRGFTDWRLRVVHNPLCTASSYESEVESFIRENGMGDRIVFRGRVSSRQEMAALYSSSDITVLPSRHESYCLPLVESLWCGTPVIANEVGAVAEVADGLANLVGPGDIQALAVKMEQLTSIRPRVCCDRSGVVESEEFLASCRSLLADRNVETFARRFFEGLSRIDLHQRVASKRL